MKGPLPRHISSGRDRESAAGGGSRVPTGVGRPPCPERRGRALSWDTWRRSQGHKQGQNQGAWGQERGLEERAWGG